MGDLTDVPNLRPGACTRLSILRLGAPFHTPPSFPTISVNPQFFLRKDIRTLVPIGRKTEVNRTKYREENTIQL